MTVNTGGELKIDIEYDVPEQLQPEDLQPEDSSQKISSQKGYRQPQR